MILIENTEVLGWEHAIRGMRNPMNSLDKSDSEYDLTDGDTLQWFVGNNDHELMMKLARGGPVHAKYRRYITVYLDITAPLYWWKEFETYRVGVASNPSDIEINSCSTMHKIHAKEFTLDDFSHEHLGPDSLSVLRFMIIHLNVARTAYTAEKNPDAAKDHWWQMIQLLPSSYNQKRTIMLNYEVLAGMYEFRKNHKLDEWREFCRWIEDLPYSEIITE